MIINIDYVYHHLLSRINVLMCLWTILLNLEYKLSRVFSMKRENMEVLGKKMLNKF
jgi:hypothetical protein